MTEQQRKKATIIGVVAGVEVAFGVIEGIVMPNLFDRKKGDPFIVPNKSEIAKIGGTLLLTGVVSGVVSEYVLEKFNVADENRAKVITGVAIGLNVVETVITYNINKKLDKNFKVSLPSFAQFAPAFAFLVLTSFIGGYVSDYTIAALGGGESNSNLASNTSTSEESSTLLATIK
jgi:hypothetical protein